MYQFLHGIERNWELHPSSHIADPILLSVNESRQLRLPECNRMQPSKPKQSARKEGETKRSRKEQSVQTHYLNIVFSMKSRNKSGKFNRWKIGSKVSKRSLEYPQMSNQEMEDLSLELQNKMVLLGSENLHNCSRTKETLSSN